MPYFDISLIVFLLASRAAIGNGQSAPTCTGGKIACGKECYPPNGVCHDNSIYCSQDEPWLCGTSCYSNKMKQQMTPLTVLPSTAIEVPNYEAVPDPDYPDVKWIKLPCAVDRRVCLMYCMLRSDCKWVMFVAGTPTFCVGFSGDAVMQFKRSPGAWLLSANVKAMTVIGEVDYRCCNKATAEGMTWPAEKGNCEKLCTFHPKCTVALHNIYNGKCFLKEMDKNYVANGRHQSGSAYTAVLASYV